MTQTKRGDMTIFLKKFYIKNKIFLLIKFFFNPQFIFRNHTNIQSTKYHKHK